MLFHSCCSVCLVIQTYMGSFNKEVDSRLAKRPLKTNGRLANLELTSLVNETTRVWDERSLSEMGTGMTNYNQTFQC